MTMPPGPPRAVPPSPPIPPAAPRAVPLPPPRSRPRTMSPQELLEHQAAVIDAQMRALRAQTVLIVAYQDLLSLSEAS